MFRITSRFLLLVRVMKEVVTMKTGSQTAKLQILLPPPALRQMLSSSLCSSVKWEQQQYLMQRQAGCQVSLAVTKKLGEINWKEKRFTKLTVQSIVM